MLGGGTWVTQNKVLPGSYINVVGRSIATATVGSRGIVAIPLTLTDYKAGEVIYITSAEFVSKPYDILGEGVPEASMKALREVFKHATSVYVYNTWYGDATKARITITLDGTNPTTGVVITGGTTTITQLGALSVGGATLSAEYTLKINGVVKEWTTNGSEIVPAGAIIELTATAGGALTSGAKSAFEGIGGAASVEIIDGKAAVEEPEVQDIINAFEPHYFNVLAAYTSAAADINTYVTAIKTWRENLGKMCQVVIPKITSVNAPNYEGVIMVANTSTDDTDSNGHSLVAWVAGAEAGCEVYESCTNMLYDGELTINNPFTQTELEACINNGEFAFHLVYGRVRVLEDINTLTQTTADKTDDFKNNQTIRVTDQSLNDISILWNTKYVGQVPNDDSGRTSLWADLVKYFKNLEILRAIENFDSSLLTVEQGDTKKSVVVNCTITVTNAMSQLYMTIVVQ